jgi:hypothetical protein
VAAALAGLYIVGTLIFSETSPPKIVIKNTYSEKVSVTIDCAEPDRFSKTFDVMPLTTIEVDPLKSISLNRRAAVEVKVDTGKNMAIWRADENVLEAYSRNAVEIAVEPNAVIIIQPPWLRHTDWKRIANRRPSDQIATES